jgi:thymidylate synthase
MQNASIFPKNIHFFATLIAYVASDLGWEVGEYTHSHPGGSQRRKRAS